MKITFLTYSKTATTDPNFPLRGVSSRTGRLDVIARMLLHALTPFKDAIRFVAVLDGPPKPPLTLFFEGQRLEAPKTEREALVLIRKCMRGELEGCKTFNLNLQEAIDKFRRGNKVYILKEGGGDLWETAECTETLFLLGSHHDVEFPVKGKAVSVGPLSYLASHCITLTKYIISRRCSL